MIYYRRIFITPFTALETMRIFFIFLLLTVLCGCQPRKIASLKPLPLKVTTISPETLTLTSKSDRLVLRAGSSAAILNKVAIQLDHPVQCDADGNWSLHPGTIRDILLPVLPRAAAGTDEILGGRPARQLQAGERERILAFFAVERDCRLRAYRQAVLAAHAPRFVLHLRQTVGPKAERPEKAISNAGGAPRAL
jgi:hypothetical protein